MAFETAVHVKSMVVFAVDPVGEVATAGLLLSHVVAFCTLNLACGEVIDGHVFVDAFSLKIASTYHSMLPLVNAPVAEFVVTCVIVANGSPFAEA